MTATAAAAWQLATEWQQVRKPLQTEAGESWQSLSYVHSVVYITIQWSSDNGPRVADLGAEHETYLCIVFAGCLAAFD